MHNKSTLRGVRAALTVATLAVVAPLGAGSITFGGSPHIGTVDFSLNSSEAPVSGSLSQYGSDWVTLALEWLNADVLQLTWTPRFANDLNDLSAGSYTTDLVNFGLNGTSTIGVPAIVTTVDFSLLGEPVTYTLRSGGYNVPAGLIGHNFSADLTITRDGGSGTWFRATVPDGASTAALLAGALIVCGVGAHRRSLKRLA